MQPSGSTRGFVVLGVLPDRDRDVPVRLGEVVEERAVGHAVVGAGDEVHRDGDVREPGRCVARQKEVVQGALVGGPGVADAVAGDGDWEVGTEELGQAGGHLGMGAARPGAEAPRDRRVEGEQAGEQPEVREPLAGRVGVGVEGRAEADDAGYEVGMTGCQPKSDEASGGVGDHQCRGVDAELAEGAANGVGVVVGPVVDGGSG